MARIFIVVMRDSSQKYLEESRSEIKRISLNMANCLDVARARKLGERERIVEIIGRRGRENRA